MVVVPTGFHDEFSDTFILALWRLVYSGSRFSEYHIRTIDIASHPALGEKEILLKYHKVRYCYLHP